MKEFEVVLASFDNETDSNKAFTSFVKANNLAKEIKNGRAMKEKELRQLMQLYLDAFWVYTENRDTIAFNIHEIGKILEKECACQLGYDNAKQMYYSDCPAMLLHNDFGFSMRGTEKYRCSICGKDVLDCEHLTDEYYDNVKCINVEGLCNICCKNGCNEHKLGETYNHVPARKIAYDIHIITFDIVEDPAMKFSRVTKIYFSKNDINLSVEEKETFIYGKTNLYCHHCSICKGYTPNRFHDMFKRKQ